MQTEEGNRNVSVIFKAMFRLEVFLKWTCVTLISTIIIVIAAQVFFRYVLDISLSYTDEISQMALTWLTFLGAAWVYRSNKHIGIDLLSGKLSKSSDNKLKIFTHVIVISTMSFLILQIVNLMPLMRRLEIGTLEMSRFEVHFLPLLIASGIIILFAIEAIMSILLNYPVPHLIEDE